MPLTSRPWPGPQSRAVVFNTEAAQAFLTDPEYRSHAALATDVYCDGVGLQVYIALRFGRLVRRRHGPDVLSEYLRSRRDGRVLLLGGTEAAHGGLRERFPSFFRFNSVTADRTLVSPADMEALAKSVVQGGYDDVLIFYGLGKQECMQHLLHAAGYEGASIGLGAAIDFVSGAKPRASAVWQRLGLEWLPRLVRERRMWPRVVRSGALFWSLARRENAALRLYLLGGSAAEEDARPGRT